MAGSRDLQAIIRLGVDSKSAVADFKMALKEISDAIGKGVDLGQLEGQMQKLTSVLDKVITQYDRAVAAKEKFGKLGSDASRNDIIGLQKINEAILALISNIKTADREVQSLYNKSARIPGSREGVYAMNRLGSSQKEYMAYQSNILSKQAAGKPVSTAELDKLERLRTKFEAATTAAQAFQMQVQNGSKRVSQDIAQGVTNAIDRATSATVKLDKNIEKVFGTANKNRIEAFARSVNMQMNDVQKSVSRALDSINSSLGKSTLFNSAAASQIGNAISGHRSMLENKLKGAKTPAEQEIINQQLSQLEELEYATGRKVSAAQYKYNRSMNPNYGISGTAVRGDVALGRAKSFIAEAATRMNQDGAISFGAGLSGFDKETSLHLNRIRTYVLQARKEIQEIEAGNVDAHPDSLKALKNFVDEAVSLQKQIEGKAGALSTRGRNASTVAGGVRALAQDQMESQFAPASTKLGRIYQVLRGDKAFAGMSPTKIQEMQLRMQSAMATGDLGPEEMAMAQALISTGQSRMAAMRRSPFGSTIRSPFMQSLFLRSASFLKGAGGMFSGAFSPYGNQMIGSAFHAGNIYTSHISALMGLPLYGMGIAGLGMAGVRGALGLAGQAETQKLTLSGLVNTFMKFNRAGIGQNYDPASNFVLSQRYTENLYQQIRKRASRSILTTPELFEYFMAGGSKGLAKGLSGEQALGVVDKMATLGKAMGLRPLDVQQDIRATLSGDVRMTNKLGTLMGFSGPGIKQAFAKGPDEFLKMFEEKFKGFAVAMEGMPKTWQGSLNMLLNVIQQFGIDIGQKIAPILIPALKELGATFDKLKSSGKFNEIAGSLGNAMKTVINWFTALITHFDFVKMAIIRLVQGIVIYKAVATINSLTMALGPSVGAIGALSTAVVAFVAVMLAQRALLAGDAQNKRTDILNAIGGIGSGNLTSDQKDAVARRLFSGKGNIITVGGQDIAVTPELKSRLQDLPGITNNALSNFSFLGKEALRSIFGDDTLLGKYAKQYGLDQRDVASHLLKSMSTGTARYLYYSPDTGEYMTEGEYDNATKSKFLPSNIRIAKGKMANMRKVDVTNLAYLGPAQKVDSAGGTSTSYIAAEHAAETSTNLSILLSKAIGENPENISALSNDKSYSILNEMYRKIYTDSNLDPRIRSRGKGAPFRTKQDIDKFMALPINSLSKEDKTMRIAFLNLGYGSDKGLDYTTNPTEDTNTKKGKQLRREIDYRITAQQARLSALTNLISKTPDLAMTGGKFAKYGMLEQELSETKLLRGLEYQGDLSIAAKEGDVNAIKEAKVKYVEGMIAATNGFTEQVRALEESSKAMSDQTEEVKRATSLMIAQFGLKQAQAGLTGLTPSSVGYVSTIGKIYGAGRNVVETQYSNAMADIASKRSAVERTMSDWTTGAIEDIASGKVSIPGLTKKESQDIAKGILGTMKTSGLSMADAQKAYFAAQEGQAGQARTEGLFDVGQQRLQSMMPYAQAIFGKKQGMAGISAGLRFVGRGMVGAERMAAIKDAQAQADLAVFDQNNEARVAQLQQELAQAATIGGPEGFHLRARAQARMDAFLEERGQLVNRISDVQYAGQKSIQQEQLMYQYKGAVSGVNIERQGMLDQRRYGGLGETGLGRFGAVNTVQYKYELAQNAIKADSLKYRALISSDYGKFLGVHPQDVDRMVLEYENKRQQALMSEFRPQFAPAQMKDLRFGAVAAFGAGAYANPMGLTTMRGMMGLASSSLAGGMEYGGQQMQNAIQFLYNPKNPEMRKAYIDSIPKQFRGDPVGYARNYALAGIGGGIAGAFLGKMVGGSATGINTGQQIGMGLASLGAFANILPGVPGGGMLFGAIAGGLLGGLFGRRGHRPDPREEAHRKRIEELLSRIDKSLRPQNDYFRTINRDILFGSASRFLSGRFSADLVGAPQRV